MNKGFYSQWIRLLKEREKNHSTRSILANRFIGVTFRSRDESKVAVSLKGPPQHGC